jgi:adenosine deaminase CECR1
MYAELRPMLLDKSIASDDGKREINNAEQMKLITRITKEKQDELRNREPSQINKFPFGLKIIYCTPRSISKELMRKELDQCIELRQNYADLICVK